MILMESVLDVADNSGLKRVKCIKVLGGSFKKTANIGDKLVVSVVKKKKKNKLGSESVYRSLLIGTKKNFQRKDGSTIKFNKNYVVILNTAGKLLGSKVLKPTIKEFRENKLTKSLYLGKKIY